MHCAGMYGRWCMKFLELDKEATSATSATPVAKAIPTNTDLRCYPATPATQIEQSSRRSESSRVDIPPRDTRSSKSIVSIRVAGLNLSQSGHDLPHMPGRHYARLHPMLRVACWDLSITPEQLHADL